MRDLSSQRLQIYQNICPAALTVLQGFNELREKLFTRYKEAADEIISLEINAERFTGLPA